jgi:hypothetical protein
MITQLFGLLVVVLASINPSLGSEETPTKLATEEAEKLRFTPHITAEAVTRPKGKMAFQRAVGANLNTSLFLSAFTYSVSKRLEIGTVLTYYLFSEHKFNINFKYNFYRGQEFFWSVGLSTFSSELIAEPGEPPPPKGVLLGITALQFLVNYMPLGSRYKFAANYNSVSTNLSGFEGDDETYEIGLANEFGLDVSYNFHAPFDLTVGLGWLRQDGVSALEEVEFGFGSSVRWYRPEKLFSSPTAGLHYSPESGSVEVLLSSSLY